MNRKEEFLEKNKNIKNINEPKNPYNHINPNELPNADDYINIINDSESEEESPNKENIKYKQLKNENKEDKTLFESESKIKFTKKDEKKEQTKEKSTDKEIRIFKDIQNLNKENKEHLPPLYFYEKIKDEIFPKINLKEEIKENFIKAKNILSLEKDLSDETFYSKKTRKRGLNKSYQELKKKRGRKKNDNPSYALHNKDSQDNIIKKIKSKLLDYLLNFINSLLISLKKKK